MEIVNSQQYQELLKNMEGKRAGAVTVDVAREGTPPEEAWEEPREEETPLLLPPRDAEAEATVAEESRPRRVSIQSTTVPSQASLSLDEPEARKRGAETAELDTILEEEEAQAQQRDAASGHQPASASSGQRRAASEEKISITRATGAEGGPVPGPDREARADEAQHRRRTKPPGTRSRQWIATRRADA